MNLPLPADPDRASHATRQHLFDLSLMLCAEIHFAGAPGDRPVAACTAEAQGIHIMQHRDPARLQQLRRDR